MAERADEIYGARKALMREIEEARRRREVAEREGFRLHAEQHSGDAPSATERTAQDAREDVDGTAAAPEKLTERERRKIQTSNDAVIRERVNRRERAAVLGVLWAWCSKCGDEREIHKAQGKVTFTRKGVAQVRAPCPACWQGLVQMVPNEGLSPIEEAAVDALKRAEAKRQQDRLDYMMRLLCNIRVADAEWLLQVVFGLKWGTIRGILDKAGLNWETVRKIETEWNRWGPQERMAFTKAEQRPPKADEK